VDRAAINVAVVTHGGRNDAFWDVVEDAVMRAKQNLVANVTYRTTEVRARNPAAPRRADS